MGRWNRVCFLVSYGITIFFVQPISYVFNEKPANYCADFRRKLHLLRHRGNYGAHGELHKYVVPASVRLGKASRNGKRTNERIFLRVLFT